ncbi:Oidioi.mRNA.OKI2018_I69.XSR.g14246.t1.cds [Oikopleura dioica]|uniref:Oidioi.mRNA.OKI2018_I69.XSR.g14246.t1.cds n=1 Tax=Oikopleura dioica TaxID=34765 RepID=A0ABN7SFH9_OIKDI|nr:Oidioi.mRNA.OKI2018_I69.XSR.g14246.t1.cds [Oikopleura dioica]
MGQFALNTSEPPTEEDILAIDEQNDLAEMDADEELRLLAENPLPPEGPELEYGPLDSDDEDMTDLQSLPDVNHTNSKEIMTKECITPPLERSTAASNSFRGPIANSSMISPQSGIEDQGASFGSFEETVIRNTRETPHERAMHKLRQRQKDSTKIPPAEWGGAITRTSSIAASVTSEIRRNFNANLNFQSAISEAHSMQRAPPNSNGNSTLNTTESGAMDDAGIQSFETRANVCVKTEPSPDGMELHQRKCRKLQDRVQGCLDFGRHLLSRESLRHVELSHDFTREENLAEFFKKTVGDLKNKIDRKYQDYIDAVQLQREMELKKLEHDSERKLTALLHSAGVLNKISTIEKSLEKESKELDWMEQDPLCNINYNYDAKKTDIDSTRQAFIACRDELFRQITNRCGTLFSVRYSARTPKKDKKKEDPKEGAIDLSKTYQEPPTSSCTSKDSVSTMPSRRAMSKRSRTEVEDHQVRKKTASFPIHNEAQTAQRPRNLPSRGYALPLKMTGKEHQADLLQKKGSTYSEARAPDRNQFNNRFVSDKHFKKETINLKQPNGKFIQQEIKLTPGIPWKVRKDPFSNKKAYEGIYDFIDILGSDPSITPHQLCKGHPSYRAVDLGIHPKDRRQDGYDPRRHVAELRTLYNITNHQRRHQYGRVENQWRRRYLKRVEWLNRISGQLHG